MAKLGRGLRVVLGGLFITLALAGGCTAPSSAGWDFHGMQGEKSLEVPGLHWIHIAVSATSYVEKEDFQFSVTWHFTNSSQRPLAITEYEGIPANESHWYPPAQWLGCAYPHSMSHAYGPPERCAELPDDTRSVDGYSLRFFFDRATEREISRPTFHYVVAYAGADDVIASIHARWADLAFNMTYGGREDTFVLGAEDFANVDARTTRIANVSLPTDRLLLATFNPHIGVDPGQSASSNSGERPAYTSPEGKRKTVGLSFDMHEVLVAPGKWTFEYPQNEDFPMPATPVLWGARILPANLPPPVR